MKYINIRYSGFLIANEDIFMGINENIFNILKEKKMTQKQFSQLSGISESTISDWKRKGKTPGADKLLLISKALDVSIDRLLSDGEAADEHDNAIDYRLDDDEKSIIEMYRSISTDQKKRLLGYFESLAATTPAPLESTKKDPKDTYIADSMFIIQKNLAKKLRKLARLDRLKLDETKHTSGLNLHLFKYLDYIGLDKLEYIKKYLSNIQPFMISEIKSQEKFENAVCVLDDYYRISVYIKVDSTKGEEIVVSFHENNKLGIAKRNSFISNLSYVYVFADSIGSHLEGTDDYSINFFVTRGVSTFPINVPAIRYDEDGFIVRYTYINNAIIDVSNRYLENASGKDIFSNISIMIDSLFIQSDSIGKQLADTALCVYCSTLQLLDKDKEDLLSTLKERYKVNSIKALPQVLERVEMNITGISHTIAGS